MTYPLEAVVKNTLTILSSKKSYLPIEKKLFQRLCVEVGLTNELYLQFNDEWQAGRRDLVPGRTAEENLFLLSVMLCAAFFDNMIYQKERELLDHFEELTGLGPGLVAGFLATHKDLEFGDKVLLTVSEVRNALKAPAARGRRQGRMSGELPPGLKDGELAAYVASQVTAEGIDELQALYLCHQLRLNAALSGPPGIGKTESVIELSRILETPLFTKVCSTRTTESHIISHPVLMEQNGTTVTAQEDGALCLAMQAPGIFYGDEYNLLKEDVQKRLNSAFDDRRSIDRNDGTFVRAQDGFFAVISYNPSQKMGQRDLEESVADRFVHFHFSPWTSDLKAYISAFRASRKQGASAPPKLDDFGLNLEQRGITPSGRFVTKAEKGWTDFFTHKAVTEKPHFRYQSLAVRSMASPTPANLTLLKALDTRAYNDVDLARIFARFTDLASELATTGRSSLLSTLGLDDLKKKEEFELLSCHLSSTRIVAAALQHHQKLKASGWGPYLAQSYATGLIIHQLAYGAYRDQKLKGLTTLEVLRTIASALGLYADQNTYNTNLIRTKVL